MSWYGIPLEAILKFSIPAAMLAYFVFVAEKRLPQDVLWVVAYPVMLGAFLYFFGNGIYALHVYGFWVPLVLAVAIAFCGWGGRMLGIQARGKGGNDFL